MHGPLRRTIVFAIFLITLATALKIVRLNHPPSFYFDEVYHAFTASEYLHGNPKAYDPWAKPPEGLAYEWTHPPLAKLIMTLSLKATIEKGWGYRISGVLFSAGCLALTLVLSWLLFSNLNIGLLAVFFLSFDGLFFAQSRIGMNDIYFLFFMLSSFVCYLRLKREIYKSFKWSLMTGVSLGLAASTKWTALYTFAILCVDFAITTRWLNANRYRTSILTIAKNVALWVAVVAGLYVASYTHYFAMGYTWDQFVELQKQMWWYHSGLKATHAFQSKPWQWILNLKPVWMYVKYDGSRASYIFNYGNSVFLIAGLLAATHTIWRRFRDSQAFTESQRFILLAYFLMWLPWVFSPRIMLFYHYLPALPALALILSHKLISDSRLRRWQNAIVFGCVVWFVVYFPINAGLPISDSLANGFYKLTVPYWP